MHAADFCYKLPDHMSLEEGALMEPLAVGGLTDNYELFAMICAPNPLPFY